MIPPNLHWALEDGHRVRTPGGVGKTKVCKRADLVLLSGKLSVGYPSENALGDSGNFTLDLSPGTYPVYATLAKHANNSTLAFITVRLLRAKIVAWQKVGTFFTDHGNGILCDAKAINLFKQKRGAISLEEWQNLKMQALTGGDGNLILDESTGTNAIVFQTCDWSYDCYLGRDSANQITCFIIDGLVHNSKETSVIRAIRRLFTMKFSSLVSLTWS